MKKGQIYEGLIEEVDFPNKAIVQVVETDESGQEIRTKVVVKGGIEGQKIAFSIKKQPRNKLRGIRQDAKQGSEEFTQKQNKACGGKCSGRLLKILEKSPLETAEPACPQFGNCGGCNYQSLPWETQLALKKKQVLKIINAVYPPAEECKDGEALQESKYCGYQYDGILTGPEMLGYRNKMEFSFGDEIKDGPLTLGLHKKGSFHDIIDAECCKIVHKDFTRVLAYVRDYCREAGISFYHKTTHQGILRHLLVRRASSTGELLAALVVSSQQQIDWSRLSQGLQQLPLEGKLVGFLLITNDSLGDVVQSDQTEILFGSNFFTEELLGLKFKITPFSFFQTNTKGAEVLYQRVREYVSSAAGEDLKQKVVFDLYSGTGTIAQVIAPIAGKVIGVEIVEEAVEAARENAQENGLDNCEFIAGDVFEVLNRTQEKPDFIILDPPRDGIHPKALKKIIDYGVENIVYISCKPTSLGRDLEVFREKGYELRRVSNVDLFPGTVHVECVVLMSKVQN